MMGMGTGITANIFNDVRFTASDRPARSQFQIGQIDFFVQGHLDERYTALLETVAEFDNTNQPSVDVERIQFNAHLDDRLRIAIGRIHAPFGYYNSAYHHAAWHQTAVDRPHVIAFEDDGGLLPVHLVGIEARGVFPKGKLDLGYAFNFANGRGERPDEVTQFVDHNFGKAVNVQLYTEHRPTHLRFGINGYLDRIPPVSDPTTNPARATSIREVIFGAHAVWIDRGWEVISEYYQLRHTVTGASATAVHHGFFTIASYGLGDLRPYFRVQTIQMDKSVPDPFFDPTIYTSQTGLAAGIKYWLADLVAVKFEYERQIPDSGAEHNLATVQVAYGF